MANAYTKQVLEDGARNFVVKLTGILDTTDQALAVVISPSDCAQFIPKNFRIDHIDFAISDGIELQLWWEGVPTDALILPLNGRNKFNYDDIGGLLNNAPSPTGAIKLKTTGYMIGTQVYALTVWLVKMGV